jgi:topoisomerase-4 subunit A
MAFDVSFSNLDIKSRTSIGNILTRYPVQKIELKEKGSSTLGGIKIWWDDTVQRLNQDGKGLYLGDFSSADRILVITRSGEMRLSGHELTTHFEEDLLLIQKFDPTSVFTVVYYDGSQKYFYIKRFKAEATERPVRFFDEHAKSRLVLLSEKDFPRLELKFGGKHKKRTPAEIDAADFIAEKSYKAKGKRLSNFDIVSVNELKPVRFKENVPELAETFAQQEMPAAPEANTPEESFTPSEPETGPEKPVLPERGRNGEQMSLF